MRIKKNRNIFLYGGIFLLFLGALGFHFLFEKNYRSSPLNIRVGLLKGDRIWVHLPAIKHLKEDLNTALKGHQKKFAVLEGELRKKNQELIRLQQMLTVDNKNQRVHIEKKQKEFSTQVMRLQKEAEETQKKVNDLYDQSMTVIKEKITESIKKVARKKGLSLVLYDNQVAYHDGSLDITDDVFNDLKEFQYPSLRW